MNTETTLLNVKQTLEMLLEDVAMTEQQRQITQWTLDQVVKTLAQIAAPPKSDKEQR